MTGFCRKRSLCARMAASSLLFVAAAGSLARQPAPHLPAWPELCIFCA